MKPRVINGKRYNVQGANFLGEKDGLALYRKTTGEYFATKDNDYIILRHDRGRMLEIAKAVLSEREFFFEFEIRDSDQTNASLALPTPIYERVAELAKEKDVTIKEVITEILFNELF